MTVPTARLRASFAAALPRLDGTEVPAHTTLLDGLPGPIDHRIHDPYALYEKAAS